MFGKEGRAALFIVFVRVSTKRIIPSQWESVVCEEESEVVRCHNKSDPAMSMVARESIKPSSGGSAARHRRRLTKSIVQASHVARHRPLASGVSSQVKRSNPKVDLAGPFGVSKSWSRPSNRLFHAAPASMQAHEVVSLPGLPVGWEGKHYAGMLGSEEATGGRLFYWFFEKSKRSNFHAGMTVPLLIWLNGGPGCTSMDGLFLENGPFRLRPGSSKSLELREASWHMAANLLYVDQPTGTGFSWSKASVYCHDDDCIARHFVTFLRRFARVYTKLVMASSTRSVPIYFSGESHAGHYVPLLVEALLRDSLHWDVRGMALGNAWIDPYNQYDVSRVGAALGLVAPDTLNKLRAHERSCQLALERKQYMTKICWNLLDDVVLLSGANNREHLKANMYDTRESVRTTADFPPGHDRVEAYMNTPEVRAALHVDPGSPRFYECANPPYNALKHQDGLGVMPSLKALLERTDIRVLFYNGQFDLICNHIGVERALFKLDWTHADAFRRAHYRPWLRHSRAARPAGHLLAVPRLALLLVVDSGHMVPMNQPEVALDIIFNFIKASESRRPIGLVFHANADRLDDKFLPFNASRHGLCADICGSFLTHDASFNRTATHAYKGAEHAAS